MINHWSSDPFVAMIMIKEGGTHYPRLAGMFILRATLSSSDHSRAWLNQPSRVMRSLEHGGLSKPTPFSTSTHHSPCSPREISCRILPTFYQLGYFIFHVDVHHRSSPRGSHLMAEILSPARCDTSSPPVSNGHIHHPSSSSPSISNQGIRFDD